MVNSQQQHKLLAQLSLDFISNCTHCKTEMHPKYLYEAEEKISQLAIQKSSAKMFPKGSVGIAMYGATIGKLAIWKVDASTNQACAVAQVNDGLIYNEFLYYFLLAEKNLLIKAGKGGAQPNISQGILKAWPIELPPLKEQHRIVAKIEELFSEIDKGVESLQTAKAQLQVYRQALLKHSFEGKLTAQWRVDNPDKVVSAEQLLEQIKQAREERYQQQLAGWQTAVEKWEFGGKEGKKPSKPKKLSDLNYLGDADRVATLKLPNEWVWVLLGDISDISGGLTKNSKRLKLPLTRPFLRVANVYANQLRLEDVHNIGIKKEEIDRVLLVKDDLLIVEGNGSLEHIGRVAKWDGSIENCVHQNHLIKARTYKKIASPDFLIYFLLSKTGRDLIVKEASSTSGLHTLSLSKVKNLKIPMCSLPEALEIVDVLEEKLSGVEATERALAEELTRAEGLRQSILKKAFSGQLVPQDSSDEPASKLLERIKAEKAARAAEAKTKTTRKARKPKTAKKK